MPHQQKAQKNFAARWFEEVWNKSRREAIDEMFPEDAVLHDGRAEYRGPTEFKRFYDARLSNPQTIPSQQCVENTMTTRNSSQDFLNLLGRPRGAVLFPRPMKCESQVRG